MAGVTGRSGVAPLARPTRSVEAAAAVAGKLPCWTEWAPLVVRAAAGRKNVPLRYSRAPPDMAAVSLQHGSHSSSTCMSFRTLRLRTRSLLPGSGAAPAHYCSQTTTSRLPAASALRTDQSAEQAIGKFNRRAGQGLGKKRALRSTACHAARPHVEQPAEILGF